jgi:hypothetical protein
MPDIPLPEDLSTYVRSLESRIRALETTPRLQNASFPWYPGFVANQDSTTSTSYGDLATPGPSVNVTLGDPGRVIVTVSAFCETTATYQADIGLYVDGSFYSQVLLVGSSRDLAANFSSSRIHFPFSAGTHTFELKYRTSGGTSSFAARSLIVQPY